MYLMYLYPQEFNRVRMTFLETLVFFLIRPKLMVKEILIVWNFIGLTYQASIWGLYWVTGIGICLRI